MNQTNPVSEFQNRFFKKNKEIQDYREIWHKLMVAYSTWIPKEEFLEEDADDINFLLEQVEKDNKMINKNIPKGGKKR